MISDHRWPLATATLCSATLCWATLLGCQDQGAAGTQPAVQPAARTVPPVEPRPTRPADEPPHPSKVAPPSQPAPAPVPMVLIDCTTSAMSAQRIANLKIPYYKWFGQSDDPESLRTGKINIGLLLENVRKQMGPNPTGWGMLDYEDPLDAWLNLPATDPRNRQASAEVVAALKALKKEFPNVKWTSYGHPRLDRQFPDGKAWTNGSDASKQAEIERRIATYSDILRESDWISPSIYDVYETAKFKSDELPFIMENEALWREQVVRLGRTIRERLHLPQVPVIPCVSVLFQPGGRATAQKPIPQAELLSDQIEPSLRGGADGFAIWTAVDFVQELVTMPDSKELVPLNRETQAAARAAWTDSFLGGKKPRDWTDPELKFTISQATGKVVADGAQAIQEAVKKSRASSGTKP